MAQSKKKGSYLKRLLTAALACLGLAYTVVFFGPLEMVAFSGGSLVYTYQNVALLLAVMGLAFVAVVSPLLALLRGKAFRIAVSVIAGVALAAYLQALLLNDGLGLLTGDAIVWEDYTTFTVLGTAVWLAVLGGMIALSLLKKKLWKAVVRYSALLLVVMQLVPTVTILCGTYAEKNTPTVAYYLSDTTIDRAGSENIYIFVLDRLDYDYITRTLKTHPGMFDGLDGFTLYDNATSAYARTRPALVHMLTGQEESTFRVSASAYYQQVWQGDNVIAALKADGWKTEFFATPRNLFATDADTKRYADNYSNSIASFHYDVLAGKLLQLSAFRYSPMLLKPLSWGDTNYFNDGTIRSSNYQYDDVGYSRRLEKLEAGSGKQFKLIHFFGPHAPYTMNADGTLAEGETTVVDQLAGSFHNLTAIFNRMKAEGIYDSATILVLGDHGSAVSDLKPLQKATRIGLFYKPAGSSGTPLQHSAAPVCSRNVPATLAKAAGLPYAALGTPLDEVAEDATVDRYYYKTVCDEETYRERWLYTYRITGDAANFANWTLISEEEIPYSYN